MMKISLRHPSGLEIEFEGDEKAFDRFSRFLSTDVGSFVNGLSPANQGDVYVPALVAGGQSSEDGEDGEADHDLNALDPRAVAKAIERVSAKTDIERVTVIAHAAIEAGLPGIEYDLIDKLYGDMGLEKPARFAKAFSNAKARGLVKSVKHGTWAPTVQGENYARLGKKPSRRVKRGNVVVTIPPRSEQPLLDAGTGEAEGS